MQRAEAQEDVRGPNVQVCFVFLCHATMVTLVGTDQHIDLHIARRSLCLDGLLSRSQAKGHLCRVQGMPKAANIADGAVGDRQKALRKERLAISSWNYICTRLFQACTLSFLNFFS